MFDRCTWLNEPEVSSLEKGLLHLVTGDRTDFWRETHYGFVRDDGHLFACPAEGDFTAEVRVRARYETLYDQAGIMVRIDERRWMKFGVEFSDGMPQLGSVLTDGMSDWATGAFAGNAEDFRVRATVKDGVLRLQASVDDGRSWTIARLAPFPRSETYLVGPFACTPERAGLAVTFSDFHVIPAIQTALHDPA